jgi:nucleoside-diphosphate-sugar epimerase
MKISVFGGTGFIGETFCKLCSNEVVVVPRNERHSLTNNILYFIGTTTNQSVFADLKVDIDTNLKVLIEVLSNCKEKNITFNFISSCFVYGNDVINAKETDECNPTGFYSITKRCAEQLLISFCKTFDISYRILRIGNVYGLDPTISSKKNVLGYFIKNLKENKDIKLYNGGNYLKDYMYVNDVCRSIKFVLNKGNLNEIYNISSGSPIYFREIVEDAKSIIGSTSQLIDTPFPKEQEYIQVKNMTMNNDKLTSLGFDSSFSFYEGLKNLCNVL